MRARVLRPFPYSRDGSHIEAMGADREFYCRDDLAPGLLAEGWIERLPEPAPPAPDAPAAAPKVVKRDDGKFDVIGADGKALNDEPLTKAQARSLLDKQPDEPAPPAPAQ